MRLSLKIAVLIVSVALVEPLIFGAADSETWFEVQSPHFSIISNAGENQARRTVIRLEQIRSVFRQSLTFVSTAPSPVITVFAAKNEDSLRELLPEYWKNGRAHPAGIFFSRMNVFYAAIQLDAHGENPDKTFYHEYYHSLSLPYFPGMPVWLAEGLANFFGNSEIGGREAVMGRPDKELIEDLRNGQFIPLDALFKADRGSDYYNDENKRRMLYAESWALTHYLLMANNGAHKQSLANYLSALGQDATRQKAASTAFGDLAQLQAALRTYIRNDRFDEMRVPAPPAPPDATLPGRLLSTPEVNANLGGFAAARGKTAEARTFLEEAIQLDPKLGLAWRNLALVEFLDDRRKEALAAASQTIALDPNDGLTRYLRAYLIASGDSSKMRDPQVQADLRQSIASSPEFAPPYGLLAVCLAFGDSNLSEALTLAQKAISLEPNTGEYQLDAAQVLIHMQRYDEAKAAAIRALAVATDLQDRTQAERFLESLKEFQELPAENFDNGQQK